MTDKKTADELLHEWRNVCFFDHQLTMTEAADSLLNDPQPLVEARPGVGGKWTLFNTSTNEEAILVHAGIWSSNTDLNTGNFVPQGDKAPHTVSETRIQRVVSFKCDVSYTIDTTIDGSLWDNLETFETYIKGVEGFNQTERDRSPWQDGSRRNAYIISSKIFVRKSSKPRRLDFEPHEWLVKGLKAQRWQEYAINPDKPQCYDLVEDTPVKLENADPAFFNRGDIVWFAFKLSFFVSSQNWSSEIVPLEFMRVASGDGLYTFYADEDLDGSQMDGKGGQEVKRLEEGSQLVPISKRRIDDSPSSSRKRKSGGSSDAETIHSGNEAQDDKSQENREPEDAMETATAEVKVEEVRKKKLKKGRT